MYDNGANIMQWLSFSYSC